MKWFYLGFIIANFLSAAVILLIPRVRGALGRQSALWLAPLVSLPILFIWDFVGHRLGWWQFSSSHITGWSIAGLPIEELFFLYGIPFACLVIWAALRKKSR